MPLTDASGQPTFHHFDTGIKVMIENSGGANKRMGKPLVPTPPDTIKVRPGAS